MSPRGIVDLSAYPQFTAINLLVDPGHTPGPVVVPSCAQITLNWVTDSGKGGHNVLYGRYSGTYAGTQAQANAITAALASGTAWTNIALYLPTTSGLTTVSLRDVNTANNPIVTASSGGALGTSASPSMPNEVSIVGTLRTAKVGPQNRGRMYVPGWATNALAAGNIIAPTLVTNLNAWLATITSILAGQGYTWVIGQPHRAAYTSPKTGRVFPERQATSTPITSAVVRDNHWDSQRRRGLK